MPDNPVHILLVDDDKFIVDMYALKFKQAGCVIENAWNGSEAVQKLRDGLTPDIILLDIIMPVLDGLEVLKTIRAENLASKSCVIMLTNQADDAAKAKALGIDGFIVKAMNIPADVVKQTLDIYKAKKK